MFDDKIMNEVYKRPRNGPGYKPHRYKRPKKEGEESEPEEVEPEEVVISTYIER